MKEMTTIERLAWHYRHHDELNNAIRTVLTTKYKKDCKDAHKLVESFGYTIHKWDGIWYVENEELHRSVYIDNYGLHHNQYLYYAKKHGNKDINKFDFVNCLEKPLNRWYWNNVFENRDYVSRARARWQSICYAKDHVRWSQESLDECLAKLEKLQDQLVYYSGKLALEKADLRRLRKEYGLKEVR